MQLPRIGEELPTIGVDWPDLVPYSPEVAALQEFPRFIWLLVALSGTSGSCDLGLVYLTGLMPSSLELVLNRYGT